MKIGICGRASTGKNTVSNHFFSLLLRYPMQLAFADPIKEMASMMFPWMDRKCWFGPSSLRETVIPNAIDHNGNPLTCRQVLIDIGTQGRQYNPDHWVNIYDATITRRWGCEESIILGDVRFRNEFDYLRKHNYFLIKLLRNETTTPTEIQSHATETNQDQIQLSEFDAVIENNGTLEELQTKVKALKPQILEHQKAE